MSSVELNGQGGIIGEEASSSRPDQDSLGFQRLSHHQILKCKNQSFTDDYKCPNHRNAEYHSDLEQRQGRFSASTCQIHAVPTRSATTSHDQIMANGCEATRSELNSTALL